MIRSKTHIFKIMTLLFKAWIKYPRLRLCQLIGNCWEAGDNYYVEDEELVKRLKYVYQLGGNNENQRKI